LFQTVFSTRLDPCKLQLIITQSPIKNDADLPVIKNLQTTKENVRKL